MTENACSNMGPNPPIMANRTPRQVAERALICGALSFRGSLEVMDHPRAADLSGRLLPWLHAMGCGDELDPIERQELSTPCGKLSQSQRIDLRWSGEYAAFFCWMLNRWDPLSETQLADMSKLLPVLHILRPEAQSFLSAALRDRCEIEDMCVHFALIMYGMRERRIESPGRDILQRLHRKRLSDVGCSPTEEAQKRALDSISRMTNADMKIVASLYFIREHAACWFLGNSKTFWRQRANE